MEKEILIVGAGPSGLLLLALNLAKAVIKVRVLEASTEPPDGVVSLALDLVIEILLEAVRAEPNAVIDPGRRVLDVGQDGSSAWVTCETAADEEEPTRIEGSYVVGCDGSSSTVRNAVFDSKAVVLSVRRPDSLLSTSSCTPRAGVLIARIGAPEPLWRSTYGDDGSLPREDVSCPERILKRLQTVLPRLPSSPSQFEVVASSPYRAHQRCVTKFRVGRILLAADAAHLCNPFGGMGLTNGIVDVGGLSYFFIGIHRSVTSEDILDKYDTVRRGIYHNIVDKITTANFKRIMQDPQEALKSDPIFMACREAGNNVEMAGKVATLMRAPEILMHDFTQYYFI